MILNKNIIKVLEETATILKSEYKNKLESEGINSSRVLYNSVEFVVSSNNNSYLITFEAEDYWKNIEYGRKAGTTPNIAAISKWIKVKPILPQPRNGKLPTQEQLTYLISRSIKDKGIKPKPILQNSLDYVMKLQNEKLQKAIGKDYELSVGIMMKEELNNNNINIKGI